jgi:hypothetical protein
MEGGYSLTSALGRGERSASHRGRFTPRENRPRYPLNSVVGISTGYGLDDRGIGVQVPVESRIFCTPSTPALGSTQRPIQWVPGALSLGIKREEREADQSLPASAEVKNIWIYTSSPPYAFMA